MYEIFLLTEDGCNPIFDFNDADECYKAADFFLHQGYSIEIVYSPAEDGNGNEEG